MMTGPEAPGFRATIHHSHLKPALFWPGMPFHWAIGIIFGTLLAAGLTSMLWMFLVWRVLVLGILVYVGVAGLTKDDHHRLTILWRYLKWPRCLE